MVVAGYTTPPYSGLPLSPRVSTSSVKLARVKSRCRADCCWEHSS